MANDWRQTVDVDRNHAINRLMWAGCLETAFFNQEARKAFKADTGYALDWGESPIDRMIDEATGYRKEAAAAFVEWFNEHVWGQEMAPDPLDE